MLITVSMEKNCREAGSSFPEAAGPAQPAHSKKIPVKRREEIRCFMAYSLIIAGLIKGILP